MDKIIKFRSEFIKVGLNLQLYNEAQEIQSNCNGIYFKNQGTSILRVATKIILYPGQDWGFTAQPGEFFDYQFYIDFIPPGDNNCLVIWKTP